MIGKILDKAVQIWRYAKRSLQIRLGVAFALVCFVSAALAGGLAFYDHYQQSHYLQDETLMQIASYINPKHPAPVIDDMDNDSHIYVATSAGGTAHPHLADVFALDEGFSSVGVGEDSYRIFVMDFKDGRVAVMQESEYRTDAAERAAWGSVLPFLLLLPLVSGLAFWIINRQLSPVRTLSYSLKTRDAKDLSALTTDKIPSEMRGFVLSINELLQRIEKVMNQEQRFIADAAHELRSPMTALSMQAQRLAGLPMSDAAKAQTDELLDSIRRTRHLLEQLLSLARAQADHASTHSSTFSAMALFAKVIETLYPLADAKSLDLGVASDLDIKICADESLLFLLIKTLTDNAIRYTPAGGQIDLSVQMAGEQVEFIIEDSGAGIPKAERERVLEPFYRVLGTGVEGTGLGLPIANSIALRYGGRLVLLDSRFESGLKVVVSFPKAKLGVQA
ncbi:hypothetical protein B0181_07345 [Moraxella caviae]|uniref:histidine kinase n=1 Tax=Moraxella caviae TaxID=34060 RepID=A0A1T0A0K1_9GAMM|nr:ATP-binding protein [Moraxella caviae]OOR89264.1 hypothetical protein B0181_07345 [Moraxella caviae]STZ13859.1 Sensor protein qseC [Moraxella caviae]VEW11183.1 Sensor protein qseC [Moraxella caviae]VEW12056.1 Sensor protein qseC [Moraxella caviae]